MNHRFSATAPFAVVCVLAGLSAPAAAAETWCTHVTQSPEHPIPLDERESTRQVQNRVLPAKIAEGDRFAAEGKLEDAAEAYFRVFQPFIDKGMHYSFTRCAPRRVYQEAADKLRATADKIVPKLMNAGEYLGGARVRGAGALQMLLISNQYDAFVEHALDYAESEMLERDVDGDLVGLARLRLDELEQMRSGMPDFVAVTFVDDTTPLLDEEQAAFEKLAGLKDKIAARVKPLYPKITEHWLAEEARHYKTMRETDGALPKQFAAGSAVDALRSGIHRLDEHPEQVERLQARANVRGEALMKSGQYEFAADYFDVAGNEEQYAAADELVRARQQSELERVEKAVESAREKMMKTEEEQSAFQEEADEMAAEFGFDLED